jgi:hypothetical protein
VVIEQQNTWQFLGVHFAQSSRKCEASSRSSSKERRRENARVQKTCKHKKKAALSRGSHPGDSTHGRHILAVEHRQKMGRYECWMVFVCCPDKIDPVTISSLHFAIVALLIAAVTIVGLAFAIYQWTY